MSAAAGTGIEVRDLTLAYGDVRVLDGVSLSVGEGETLAVLGPSGGGKTTLLRAIVGLVRPDRGRVLVGGRDVTDVPTHLRRIGLVFQDHALWPHRDVAGNVEFGLRLAGVDRRARRERVAEVLDLVGLAGYEGRRVTELSGGEAQRVALARSLAPEPAVLLLDEPLGALDRMLHRRLLEDLRGIIDRERLTVVHVTHDQSEAMALGDRVAVLDDGRVLQVDRPEVLWRTPADEAVARFLGHEAILDVEVRDGLAWSGTTPLVALDAPSGSGRLVVRREAVRITDGGEGSGPPQLRARVLTAVFTGDATHVELLVDLGPAGPTTLHARCVGPSPASGSEVFVHLDPQGCSLLP